MIKRIQITMLTITCICVSISETKAGVITAVENGIVTKATLTLGGSDIYVKFEATSFNDVITVPATESMPWFGSASDATNLATQLSDILNVTAETTTSVYYFFAYEKPFTTLVRNYRAEYKNETWQSIHWQHNPGAVVYYATLDTSVSTVPEPSTAIAMGLLGIVGFAGNRRRRRQESVA